LLKEGSGWCHTSFENLKSGWNIRDLGKDGLKRVERVGKELIKKGFILSKITSYGLEVSLNPKLLKEIEDEIRKFYTIEFF
jgi:hypothetical protein